MNNMNDKVRYSFYLIFIYFVISTATEEKNNQNGDSCYNRVYACEANANNINRPVCGTDRRNYSSKCQVLKAQCDGTPVTVAHKGPCIEGQSSCMTVMRYALAKGGRKAKYVPRCRTDGTYATVQCAAAGAAAGCWCVTPDGKPLADTAVRNGRPDCTKTESTKHALQYASVPLIGLEIYCKHCTRCKGSIRKGMGPPPPPDQNS